MWKIVMVVIIYILMVATFYSNFFPRTIIKRSITHVYTRRIIHRAYSYRSTPEAGHTDIFNVFYKIPPFGKSVIARTEQTVRIRHVK